VQVEKMKIIQKNARIFVTLNTWGWWRLYIKLKPLTSLKRLEDDIQEKQETIEELEARLYEKQAEYVKCDDLRRNLHQEKLELCGQLESERKIAEENSETLLRTQRNLSDTLKELQDTQKDLQICEHDLQTASKDNQKLQLLKDDYMVSFLFIFQAKVLLVSY
jgi:myosin heavy subunit